MVAALAVTIALLSACAPTHPPIAAVSASAKSAAILVAIPPTIRISTHGITVFESSVENPDVSDWHLDQVALDAATRALSPKFQINYGETVTNFANPNSRLEDGIGGTTPIQIFAREHMTGRSADIVVVICLDVRAFPYPGQGVDTYQYIGVSKWLVPIFSYEPLAHSYVYATILEGGSFKVIAETPLFLPPERASHGLTQGPGGRYPQVELTGFEWSRHWANWTPDQRELVRAKITELLAASTYSTLRETLAVTP